MKKKVDPGDAPVLGYSDGRPPEFLWSCFAGLGDSNVTHNWMQRAQETGFLPPSGESLMDEQEDGTDEAGKGGGGAAGERRERGGCI